MNKSEYLQSVRKCKLNLDRIQKADEIYGTEIPEMLGKVISYAGEVSFLDEERRVLSFEGIIYASEDLGIDFVAKRIIPVIDAYDLNYIVYMLEEKKWAIYNVCDDDVYKEDCDLENIL